MTRNGIYFYLKALSYQSNKTSVYFTCFVDLLETIVGRLDRNDKNLLKLLYKAILKRAKKKKKVALIKKLNSQLLVFCFLSISVAPPIKKLHNR